MQKFHFSNSVLINRKKSEFFNNLNQIILNYFLLITDEDLENMIAEKSTLFSEEQHNFVYGTKMIQYIRNLCRFEISNFSNNESMSLIQILTGIVWLLDLPKK